MLTSVSYLVLACCPRPRVGLIGGFLLLLLSVCVSVYVQVCRALMIIALLLELFAIVTSLLGLNCIKIGSANEQTKAKIAIAAGAMSILGGESVLVLSCLCLWVAVVTGLFCGCRSLLPGGGLLVRQQSRGGLLQPAQRRHEVSAAHVSMILLANAC